MWNIKYDTNISTEQRQTHRHGEQTYDCQGAERVWREGWEVWGQQMHQQQPIHIGWVDNKALPYFQHKELYSISVTIMGKNICVCVCVCVNHFGIQQKLTQHCKSTILEVNQCDQFYLFGNAICIYQLVFLSQLYKSYNINCHGLNSVLSHFRHFATLQTVAHQAPLSMGFSRKEYWSRLSSPTPGGHSDPGLEPRSPALAGGFFTV